MCSEPQPTSNKRGWLISPLGDNPPWTLLAAAIPALLCTILIFMDQQITAVIINRKEHKLKVGCVLRPLYQSCLNLWCWRLSFPAERLRVSPGPSGGGGDARRVFYYGLALVRRRHCPLHLSRQQPEGGVGMLGTRRAAQIPGHPWAEGHRTDDLCTYGFICLYDIHSEGRISFLKKTTE